MPHAHARGTAERWLLRWTSRDDSAAAVARPPTPVARTRDAGCAPAPLRAASADCPECHAHLPTFVERFGRVDIYCGACGAFRTVVAREA